MIPLSGALTACGDTHVRSVPVPAELLTCADEPAAPDLPVKDGTEAVQLARDTLTLGYVLSMRSAWGDCRSKVDGVRAWNEAMGRK